jgi:hypothetical protein
VDLFQNKLLHRIGLENICNNRQFASFKGLLLPYRIHNVRVLRIPAFDDRILLPLFLREPSICIGNLVRCYLVQRDAYAVDVTRKGCRGRPLLKKCDDDFGSKVSRSAFKSHSRFACRATFMLG